jgi:hypothetical protein
MFCRSLQRYVQINQQPRCLFSSEVVHRLMRGGVLDRSPMLGPMKPEFAKHTRQVDTTTAVREGCHEVLLRPADEQDAAAAGPPEQRCAQDTSRIVKCLVPMGLNDLCEQLASSNQVQSGTLARTGSTSWQLRPIARASIHRGRQAQQRVRMGVKVKAFR